MRGASESPPAAQNGSQPSGAGGAGGAGRLPAPPARPAPHVFFEFARFDNFPRSIDGFLTSHRGRIFSAVPEDRGDLVKL